MTVTELTQRTRTTDYIPIWVEAFLTAKKAEGLKPGSLRFYTQKLDLFSKFCETRAVQNVSQITADELKRLLLWLNETHAPGGVHAFYRTVKCFLRWYWAEMEPDGKNPIQRVPAPRVDIPPLEPANLQDIQRMLVICDYKTLTGLRDRAIIYFLMDTGCRAGEVVRLDTTDFDGISGDCLIKQSKNGRPRVVHTGAKTRKTIRAYLKTRQDTGPALFATDEGGRIGYDGLRGIMTRRAKLAGVEAPSLHSFRRLFCLEMLRNGVDLITLARMTGHSSIEMLRRYLAQTSDDTRAAHAKGSPVDRFR